MVKCFNCPNLFEEDGKLKWCKKRCIGECLYNMQCEDFDEPKMEECRDDLSSTNSVICYCKKCEDFYKLRSNLLEEHLKTCTKCFQWKDSIWSNTNCPNEIKCVLTECPNFEICGNKEPSIYLDCYNGRCFWCEMSYFCNLKIQQKHQFCSFCQEHKNDKFVEFPKCPKHILCLMCFKKYNDHKELNEEYNQTCPLCKNVISGGYQKYILFNR